MKATMTKTHDALTAGVYQLTAVDAEKARADFTISSLGSRTVELVARPGLPPIAGRGISQPIAHRPDFYVVTERALERLRLHYTIRPDF